MKPSYRWLRLVVGAGLLVWIVVRADLRDLNINSGPRLALGVLLGVALLAAAQGLAALRWRVIIGGGAPPWSYLFRLYLIGLLFSLFLPTSVGGDTVRAAAASVRKPVDPGSAIASVVLDRVVGVIALLLYLVLGVLVDTSQVRNLLNTVDARLPAGPTLAWVVAGAVVGSMTVVAVVALSPELRLAVAQGRRVVTNFMRSPSALLKALGLGLAVQAAYVLVWAGLAHGLGWRLPWGFLLFAVPLVSLCAMAPITIAGLGVREGTWLVLLAPLGISAPNAVAYGLLYFCCVMVLAGIGGLLFAVRGVGG